MTRAGAGVAVAAFCAAVVVTVVQPFLRKDVDAAVFVAAVRAAPADTLAGPVTVLVHPPWRDDVVTALRAAHVVDDRVVITEAFAPKHGDPWPALVVVADGRWPLPRALRERVVGVGIDGIDGIDVYLVDADAGGVVDDRGPDLAAATVVVEEGGGVVACPWQPATGRHVCAGLPPWMTVGPDTLTIAGRPERCVWAHPRTGATLVVDYGVVPVAGAVSFEVALADGAADNAAGAAVTGTVFVDDEVAAVTVQHRRGFQRAVVDVGARAQARVRLTLTTDNDGQRHTCYRLRTTSPRPGPRP